MNYEFVFMNYKELMVNFKYYQKQYFTSFRGFRYCQVIACLSLILTSFSTTAQKISAILNKDKIRIGEQFELKLMVEPTSNAPLSVGSWFNVPDTFAHFQVLSRKPIDTINIASTNSYQQIITLTSFDTGNNVLPEFSVSINGKKLKTQEKSVIVIPVDVSQRRDYNDIKDIIEPESNENNTLILVAIISIIILVVSLFFYLKWMLSKRKNQAVVPIKKVSLDNVIEQLNTLEPMFQTQQYQLFSTELIKICKSFSDYQLQVTTYSKTTSEYILLLKGKITDQHLLQQYSHLLHWADQVKFAKSIPSTSECKQGISDAKAILTSLASSNESNKMTADAR